MRIIQSFDCLLEPMRITIFMSIHYALQSRLIRKQNKCKKNECNKTILNIPETEI